MGEQVGFWELEGELEEEELLSIKLAADKVATQIDKAIEALKKDEPDWDAAKKAVEAAQEAYEGYSYGYAAPGEPKLKGRFEAALKAIESKNAKLAIATLEKIKGSQYAKPKEKEGPEKERKQQAGREETARVTLAGELKKERGEFVMTLITPGEANGYDWPEEVLKQYLHVFDGMTSFTNHERRDVMAARPGGRTIDDICGVYYRPQWSDVVRGVQARWRSMPPKGPWVSDMVDTIISDREQGLPVPDVGVSVDVSFAHQGGRVTRLETGHSGDIVFNAARGPGHGEAFARVANAVAERIGGGGNVTEEEKRKQEEERQTRAMMARMAATVVDTAIQGAELPVPAAARVRKQFADATIVDVAALDSTIQAERDYLATLIEDKVVKRMGAAAEDQATEKRVRLGSTLIVGKDPMERLQLAVERWFDLPIKDPEDVPRIDMAELYRDLTGDLNCRGAWNIGEARERIGLANITDTTFADVVTDAMNKVVLHQWQLVAAEGYEWWRKVVHEQDFDSLYSVYWVTYGGFQGLTKLNPGQGYPELSITDLDTKEKTGDWTKPGGIISVPIETFDKGGPVGAFKAMPRALAVTAIRDLSAQVADIFTANAGVGPQLADSVALFNPGHRNLRASALDFDGWDECVQDHWKQTEQESGARMALRPWGILVPIELNGLGVQVLSNEAEHGTTDRNINPYQYAAERVIPVPEFTDPKCWASFVNPAVYPSIGVGYRYGRQPMIEAEPGGEKSYGRWTQDAMRWKVWWLWVVSVINYRGLQKRNVP